MLETAQLLDIVDVRGYEEYVTLKIDQPLSNPPPIEKTYNTKQWHPLTWAFFLQRSDYIKLFYEALPIHATLSLDLNPGKFGIEASDDSDVYLNKGRL